MGTIPTIYGDDWGMVYYYTETRVTIDVTLSP